MGVLNEQTCKSHFPPANGHEATLAFNFAADLHDDGSIFYSENTADGEPYRER